MTFILPAILALFSSSSLSQVGAYRPNLYISTVETEYFFFNVYRQRRHDDGDVPESTKGPAARAAMLLK